MKREAAVLPAAKRERQAFHTDSGRRQQTPALMIGADGVYAGARRNPMNRLALPVVGACVIGLAGGARAEEGMWTFDAAPLARVEQSLGVKLDRAWLDHLRLASVRLSAGCSAALVSPEGLALTNQHCLLGCVQSLSRPGHDYVADGFLTEGRAEERSCPGLDAEVLESITDVTGPIMAASVNKQGADWVLARERALAKAAAQAEAAAEAETVARAAAGQAAGGAAAAVDAAAE